MGGEAAKTDIRKQNFGCEHRGLKGATYFTVGSYRPLPKGAQRGRLVELWAPCTVSLRRGRFVRERLTGLTDKPRPSPAHHYREETGVGSPLSVATVADPVIGIGYVIVDVVATGVLPYYMEVISNQRQYMMELPIAFVTGCRRLPLAHGGGHTKASRSSVDPPRRCRVLIAIAQAPPPAPANRRFNLGNAFSTSGFASAISVEQPSVEARCWLTPASRPTHSEPFSYEVINAPIVPGISRVGCC